MGIGVAAGAVVLLSISLFLLWRRMRKNRSVPPKMAKEHSDDSRFHDLKSLVSHEHFSVCLSCTPANHTLSTARSPLSSYDALPPPPPLPRETRCASPQELPNTTELYEMPARSGIWYHQASAIQDGSRLPALGSEGVAEIWETSFSSYSTNLVCSIHKPGLADHKSLQRTTKRCSIFVPDISQTALTTYGEQNGLLLLAFRFLAVRCLDRMYLS